MPLVSYQEEGIWKGTVLTHLHILHLLDQTEIPSIGAQCIQLLPIRTPLAYHHIGSATCKIG